MSTSCIITCVYCKCTIVVVFVLLANKLAIFISFFIPHFIICIPPIITINNCVNSSQLVTPTCSHIFYQKNDTYCFKKN